MSAGKETIMKLTLLGSTGSIGTQAIDVALHLGLTVEALSAHSNVKLLEEQLRKTGARVCGVADEKAAKDLKDRTRDLSVGILVGETAAAELAARPGSDTLLNAIIGFLLENVKKHVRYGSEAYDEIFHKNEFFSLFKLIE